MPRLRYIVDRPRGKRGGNNDERYTFRSLSSAKDSAKQTSRRGGRPAQPAGRALCIDIDELIPVDASIEEQLGYHERRMLHHMTELERLGRQWRGDAPVLTTTDMARIREAVAEWDREEDRRRRGGGEHGPAQMAFFLMRDLWRAGKLG